MSGQVGYLSGRVPCFPRTLSGKNRQLLQVATSDTYPHLAQDISFTAHRAQSYEKNPVVRLRPLRGGHRPLLGSQGRHSTNSRQKMLDHDRYSNNQRDSTHGESSAWRTMEGGWHPGAPSSFRIRGIVSNGRSWGDPELEVQ